MALWTVVLTSFTPFANVYLSRNLHVPMSQIGLIFSAAQIVQLCVTLLTPMLFRALGMVNGIVATQLLTARGPWLPGRNAEYAAGCGTLSKFFRIAMDECSGFIQPADEQSTGRGTQHGIIDDDVLQCSDGLGATAGAGILFVRFGYPHVLAGIATLAVVAAILFWILVGPMDRPIPAQPRATADLWIPSI